MESGQESLFTDETKDGIEVIYSKFIDQRRMDYKSLFGGFDHLKVILMDGEGGKARREEKGLTVPERASPQLGWSVRMGDGWGRQG